MMGFAILVCACHVQVHDIIVPMAGSGFVDDMAIFTGTLPAAQQALDAACDRANHIRMTLDLTSRHCWIWRLPVAWQRP